jgi:outer membrane protein OmpA-like peptidoglycan-associated protein
VSYPCESFLWLSLVLVRFGTGLGTLSRRACLLCVVAIPIVSKALASTGSDSPIGQIPLCPGLTIVTAINQPEGDYESIKTVTAIDAAGVHVKYSNEQSAPVYPGGPIKVQKINVSRSIRTADVRSAKLYLQQFGYNVPAEVPGTTAIGVSSAVLLALKVKGEAEVGMFNLPFALPSASKMTADPKLHPNVFDYSEIYKLRRAEDSPVRVPVILNDTKTELPAIHATARSEDCGYKAEFFFLDDENNPLALKWRLGIGAASGAKAGSDRDTLKVIKIAYRCGVEQSVTARLERALAETRHADVYDIYFDFNSDEIREESEPTLHDIADIMRRHPDWKLSIAGHTDAIGGDAPNLDLSKRRAASVKNALVTRFEVNAARLTSAGHGKSRPVDTNETEEGRARNRRVELTRQ